MEFLELAKNRYSCRKFSDKKVEDNLVEKIIEAGLVAPTAVNKQPFRIWKMESEKAKESIRKVTPFTFGTDTFLVVGAKKEEAWVREFDKRNFADVDAAIVGTQIMLEIEALGLGTTWVGHFDAPKLKELCPEMSEYDLIAIFPIGYKSEEARPARLHLETRAKDELVKSL